MTELRSGGRLENWAIVEDHIVGSIFEDSRWQDGEIIRTTPIKNMDFEKREVTTRNTVYRLGRMWKNGGNLVESEPFKPDPVA